MRSSENLIPSLRPTTACDSVRVVWPYERMIEKGSVPKPSVPVIWANRMPTMSYDDIIRKKREGCKLVIDVDDDWVLDPSHYLYKSFKYAGYDKLQIKMIEIADVVIASTIYLASRVRSINKNVVVIPNALPFDEWQFTRSRDKHSGTTFVWVGGSSHRKDLSLLPRNLAFTIAGVENKQEEWKLILKENAGKRIKFRKPLREYMSLYDGHKVSLAPLLSSKFNYGKSNLKMLEAGAKGLGFIASKTRPYYNEVDCDIVTYANDERDFYSKMKYLKNNPSAINDYSERLAEHVRTHYQLDDANELRRQVFESL